MKMRILRDFERAAFDLSPEVHELADRITDETDPIVPVYLQAHFTIGRVALDGSSEAPEIQSYQSTYLHFVRRQRPFSVSHWKLGGSEPHLMLNSPSLALNSANAVRSLDRILTQRRTVTATRQKEWLAFEERSLKNPGTRKRYQKVICFRDKGWSWIRDPNSPDYGDDACLVGRSNIQGLDLVNHVRGSDIGQYTSLLKFLSEEELALIKDIWGLTLYPEVAELWQQLTNDFITTSDRIQRLTDGVAISRDDFAPRYAYPVEVAIPDISE